MKETFYKLSQTEMLSVIAGDMLPEVVVYSSYSRVFGMNYSAWYLTNHNLANYNVNSPQGKSFGDTYSGSGGGSYGGGAITPALSNDLLNLNTALGLTEGSFSVVFETIEAFFQNPTNKALLSRLGNGLAAVGVLTGGVGVINTLISKNWDFRA